VLPKVNRLVKKKDFDLVFKNGESARDGFLIVKMLKNNLPESRFGFVISKKISPKATVRNKIKRRLGDAVSGNLKNLKKSADVVVITLPGIEKKEFEDLLNTVNSSLRKIKLI